MAEQYPHDRPEQYEETTAPANPPNSVLHPEVRRKALWIYVGPLVVITIVLAIAFLYWSTRERTPQDPVVPTTGISDEATPGGGSPSPSHGTTQDEREFRGN